MKKYAVLFIVLTLPLWARATHIVGGEMNYTCLGNNEYEITLTLFRDCFYGNPNAWFDDPASIGVFNVNNQLLFEVLVPLMNNDTLEPILSSECLVVPPNVCVHTTTYRTVVTLPPIIGGYQLAYQRCCRNQTILNIVNPLASGATYGVTITERALLECNSSPKFQSWPPIYICVNEPITFDQSATDIDGDSIVYKLCAPWLGADQAIPMPQPPNPPPFQPVVWVSPPYGVSNMLNGSPGGEPLAIDLFSGLLTGLPNTIGQFVVGICIEEYRDGELISTTRRDFQYNVGQCGEAAAAFFAPEVQCGNFTVQFQNQSLGADNYLWFFNDPENPGASSTSANPSYTYPDTGLYTIMLIADPGTPCQDTFIRQVHLQYQSLTADFNYSFPACGDSLTIQVTDLSIDNISDPVQWSWQLSPVGQTSTAQNPVFYVTSSQTLTLRLTVESANGCTSNLEETFPVRLIDEVIEQDTVGLCAGGLIMLNPIFNSNYTYAWSPPTGLLNPNVPNPFAGPTQTTTYTVTITDADDFCQIERQVTVVIPEPVQVTIPEDTVICSPDYLLVATSNTGIQYYWATDANFAHIISQTDTALVTPYGPNTYYVLVRDAYGCLDVDEVTITGNGINIEVAGNPVICQGELGAVVVLSQDTTDIITYQWQPADQVLLYPNSNAAVVQPTQTGPTTFYVEMANQWGCTAIDSVIVTVVDTSFQPELLVQTQCSGYHVNFSSSAVNSPFFVWHFGDPAEPNASDQGPAVSHTYSAPGNYTVMLTLAPGLPCPDTIFYPISVGISPVSLNFDWNYATCADTANIVFTDLSVNTQSDIVNTQWIFSTGDTASGAQTSITFDESTELAVTLILTSANGCVDTLQQEVTIELIEASPQDTVAACAGLGVGLFADANPAYTYQWSPADGLDNPALPNPVATPSQTTVYVVTITDGSGNCSITRQVTALVPPALSLQMPADTNICDPTISLQAASALAEQYLWSDDPGFSTVLGQTPAITVQPGRPSVYYLLVKDAYGCTLTDSVTIGYYGINIAAEGAQTICIGDTARLTILNQSGDLLQYSWSPPEAIISGAGTPSVLVSPSASTDFAVAISNNFGCSLDTMLAVNIFNYVPPLIASAEPDTIVAGEDSQLLATEDPLYNYLWTPSAGLSGNTIFNPVATPLETTTYKVIIRDLNGCINAALVTIVVLDPICREPNIFVPNGFTPNGDGLNDVLYVRGNAIEEMFFAIYDRWGEKVFESRSPNIGWDGTFRGKQLAPDVYGYYLEVNCINGERFFKKGNITLLR